MSQTWASGQRVGSFELLEELGRGGMGAVWRARDLRLGREVALKLLQAGQGASPRQRERFLREARGLGRLRHPGVVQVHEVGEAEGGPFLAMDLLSGRTLADRLRQEGPLPEREVAELGARLARALEHAHGLGVLHRDVKPGNALLDDQGLPVLGDFGLALLQDDARLTATGQFVGTPGYWAPEQALGRTGEIGPPTDVWGLGATLYALLTGVAPRRGTSAGEQLAEAEAPISPPRVHRARLDPRLQEIVLRCLRLDPAARWSSAAQLAGALEAWLASASQPARRRAGARLVLCLPLLPAAAGVLLLLAWRDARVEASELAAHLSSERDALARVEQALALAAGGQDPAVPVAAPTGPAPQEPPPSRPPRGKGRQAVPREAQEWVERASQAESRGDLAAEIAAYTRAIELAPNWVEALMGRALAHQAAGDHKAALADWDRLVKLAPKMPYFLRMRAQARSRLGDQDGAVRDIERAEERALPEAHGLGLEALEEALRGDPAEAEARLRRALAAKPDHGPDWLFLGMLLGRRGAVEEALQAFERAAAIPATEAGARLGRAELLLRRDPDRARQDLDRVEQLQPGHPRVRTLRAALERAR